ncbi:MAG: hypothetical protein RQ736_14085, partial [Thiogranum sp.]|nr:hypothetical protein [Thiogranum sp.]
MNPVNSAILDARTGWVILGLFSVLWVFLGWLWGHKAKKLDEFMLAAETLGIKQATGYPKASEHVGDMIEITHELIHK